MEGLWEKAWRNVSVVVQDKESASQYRATTGLPRYFRSFFVRHGDAHASEWRALHASQCVTVTTAPRGARRKPFGPSEECTRRMAAALVVGLIALAGPVALGRLFRLRITLTDSAAPAGIYRLIKGVPVGRGELVAVCVPAAIARSGLARGYLRKGDCPAGAEPVAKVIGAVAGDVVKVEPGWVAVNSVTFPNSRTAARDSAERPLDHVAWGTRRVAPGEVWLFGFNDPRSWDARYFGPVPLASVRGVLRPVLTW
jgi:conjugative transfer signal peptidase TraF